jgi:hypothetical protein
LPFPATIADPAASLPAGTGPVVDWAAAAAVAMIAAVTAHASARIPTLVDRNLPDFVAQLKLN